MNKIMITAFTVMFSLCIVFTCGCVTQPATIENTVSTAVFEVSYEDTPVQYMTVNGVTLAFREFGTENTEPLLMIMGFGQTMDQWDTTFIGILSKNYHVYMYDHRGMGESTDVDAQYSLMHLSDDAAGLITSLGYDSMNIYGVSMGSSVSQNLLIDHPEKVRKAILSSASYSASIPATEKLHSQLIESAQNPDTPEGVRKEAVANLEWDGCYDNLSGIKNDVMLITGTADDLTPQSVAVEIAGQIDGSWLIRFKGIPHAGSFYAPLEYGEITTTFLEMNESPTDLFSIFWAL
ncbi:MAG: alpha/beta hydrolase [Methanomicrobiaceae archaeon]|nr:alpha/beta hydrolase [Methanomicrobiaceae archaeon]